MSDVKALFGLIDKKNKRRLIGAVICCVLSVLCGILPYLGVWGIVTCFLNERTENLFQYVCLIAAAIILKHLLFGTGTKISHKVAYQTLGETRKKLFRKIARLPMGYVKTTASGQVKTIIMDNMEQLETFYAHNIPEIISGMYGNPAGDIGHQGSRYHADSGRSVYSCRYSYDYRSDEKNGRI